MWTFFLLVYSHVVKRSTCCTQSGVVCISLTKMAIAVKYIVDLENRLRTMNAERNFKKVSSSCHNNVHYSNIHEHTLINTYHFVYLLHVCLLFTGTYYCRLQSVYKTQRNTCRNTLKHVKSFCRKIMHTAKQCFRNESKRSKWKVKSRVNNRFTVGEKNHTHIYARQKMNIFVLCGCICLTENTYTHEVYFMCRQMNM